MRLLTTACLGILLTSPQLAHGQVLLKFKIVEGLTSTLVTEAESNQTLTIAGMEVVSASTQKRTVESSNGRRNPDGTIHVEQVFKALEADLSLPGGIELQFDSANPDAPRPGTQADFLLDILNATSKSTWTMIYSADGRVVAVEGGKKTLDSLDERTQELVAKQFDPEYLKDQANTQLDLFPATPVSEGDTWRRSSDVRLEAGQSLSFTTDYEYIGTVKTSAGKELDRIAVHVKEVSYDIDEDAPTPLRITDSALKIENAEGEILFDREVGQIVQQNDKVRITGDITFSVSGNELPGKVDLTMHNRVKRS